VRAGEPLATVHAARADQFDALRGRVAAAFQIDRQAQALPLILRRIA